jgi:hypothetical protein
MSDIFNESIHDVVICLSDYDLDALIPIYEKKAKEKQEEAKHHVRGTEDGLPRRASLAVQIHWALRKEQLERGGQAVQDMNEE